MNRLNADAEPFTPADTQTQSAQGHTDNAQHGKASADERSLFMTFSNGSPLVEQEISQYFTSIYGPFCLEDVYVHRRHNREPEFGRITFTAQYFPRIILGEKEVVRIAVNNKPILLKKYIPQHLRNNS